MASFKKSDVGTRSRGKAFSSQTLYIAYGLVSDNKLLE